MRRFFKISAILLLAFLTLLIISTILLRHYFPPERIKGILLAEAEKAMGRKVSVGEVGISLLHGIDISDIYIGEDRSYGDIPFIKVKRITAGYSFSEILDKRIVLSRVTVDQPEVYIRSREGKLAFSDLIKKPTAEEKPQKPLPVTVLLQTCEVKGINIFYDADDAKASIKGINIALSGDLYPFRGINVNVSSRDEDNIGISAKGLTLNTGLLTDLRFALKGMESFSLRGKVELKGLKAGIKDKKLRPPDIGLGLEIAGDLNGGAEIKTISVAVGNGSRFNLSGSIKDLKGLKGVNIKLTGESDLAEVSRTAAEFLSIPVSGFFNIVDIVVTGNAPDLLTLKSNLLLNGVKFSHKGLKAQVDGSIKAEGNSRGDVTLSGIKLNLNNAVTVEASANASKWGKGKVSGRAHVVVDNGKSLALLPEEILKKIGKVAISGMTKVDVTGGRDSEKGPLKVNISGESIMKSLSAGPLSVEEPAVTFSITSDDLLKGKVLTDAEITAKLLRLNKDDIELSEEGVDVSVSASSKNLFKENGVVNARIEGKALKLNKGDINLTNEDLNVRVSASSPDMFRKSASVDIGIKTNGTKLNKGDIEFKSDMSLTVKAGSDDLPAREVSIDAGLELNKIDIKKSDISLKEETAKAVVSASANLRDGDISVEKLEASIPGLVNAMIDGEIEGWGDDMTLNASVGDIDHKRLMDKVPASIKQKLPKIEVGGQSAITASISGGISPGKGARPLNITGTFKTRGLAVSLPDKGIAVKDSEAEIDFDISQEVQRISGRMNVGAMHNSGLLDGTVSVLAGFELTADGPNIKIKNISATIPEKAASFSLSGDISDYMKEPRPNLAVAFSFDSKKKVDLLKGVNASGVVSFRGGIKSHKEKELELNGGLKFDHLFMSYQDRAAVNDLNGEIRMIQGIRYVKGVELMTEQEGGTPYRTTLYDLMRPYMKKGYDLTLNSASFDEFEVGPLNMDIAWNKGKVLIDRYDLSLFGGGIIGSVHAAYVNGMPEYSLYSNIAGIRFDRIFKGSKGGEDVQVNADINLKGKGTDIEGEVNVTRIGKDILDRGLLRLDPNESNPQIVDIRSKLNTLGWVPKEVSIWIRHGELNLDVTLQRRGFTLLNIVGLEKIPVRRVPVDYLIKKGLKMAD